MRAALVALALTVLPLVHAMAQQDGVIFTADFEEGAGGFITPDPAAELSVTTDPDLAFAGHGALQLNYVQAPASPGTSGWGLPGALFTILPWDREQGFRQISLALTSEIATPVMVVVVEEDDGPRYSSLLWCEAGRWSEFTLVPEDFRLDYDGPPDPNGQLDPELVSAVAIIDADSFVRMLTEQTPLFHTDAPAEQTIRLDEFVVSDVEPALALEPDAAAPLVSYADPLCGVMLLGGRDVSLSREEREDGSPVLRLDYTAPARTLFAIVHTVKQGALEGAGAIRFHARSNRNLTLVVSLDERRGPGDINKSTYHSTAKVEGADDFGMITLPLSLFRLGEDQSDPDGKLNPELVDTLSIIDATAAFENSEVINTLRLTAPVVVE